MKKSELIEKLQNLEGDPPVFLSYRDYGIYDSLNFSTEPQVVSMLYLTLDETQTKLLFDSYQNEGPFEEIVLIG
ncbi:MAG: hypothetical protein HQM13_21410 [SAR324 cluster bacterium]|nr:hypothetical protein [SAR324 cluster bacterium]